MATDNDRWQWFSKMLTGVHDKRPLSDLKSGGKIGHPNFESEPSAGLKWPVGFTFKILKQGPASCPQGIGSRRRFSVHLSTIVEIELKPRLSLLVASIQINTNAPSEHHKKREIHCPALSSRKPSLQAMSAIKLPPYHRAALLSNYGDLISIPFRFHLGIMSMFMAL